MYTPPHRYGLPGHQKATHRPHRDPHPGTQGLDSKPEKAAHSELCCLQLEPQGRTGHHLEPVTSRGKGEGVEANLVPHTVQALLHALQLLPLGDPESELPLELFRRLSRGRVSSFPRPSTEL